MKYGNLARMTVLSVFAGMGMALAAAGTDELQFIKDGSFKWEEQFWSNRTDRAIGTIGPHQTGGWVDGSWAFINGNISTAGELDAVNAYGIKYLKSGTRVVTLKSGASLSVGAGGVVLCNNSLTGLFKFSGAYFIDIACDQSWTCDGDAKPRAIVFQKSASMRSLDGATLTLAEGVNVTCESDGDFGGDIVVADDARLCVKEGCSFGAERLTLSGSSATLDFGVPTGEIADEFALAYGAVFSPTGQMWTSTGLFATGDASATNVITGRLVVPAGVFKVEVADGAVLRIEGDIVTPEGNRVDVEKSGSGTLVTGYVGIGDEPVSGTFIVNEDENVRVYGDGLGSDATIVMNGGRITISKDGATVAAPITLAGDAELCAAHGVTGTFAGEITVGESASDVTLRVSGPGCKVFTGGADLSGSSAFRLEDGDMLVTNCTWKLLQGETSADTGMFESAGTLTVRDGGKILNGTERALSHCFYINVHPSAAGVLDIGEGGELFFEGAKRFVVGQTNDTHGTLRISGGYVHDRYANTSPTLAAKSDSTAVLEFNSGRMQLSSAIRSGTGQARIVWRGGTWAFNRSYFSKHMLDDRTNISTGGPSHITVDIEGPDCVLDIGDTALVDAVTNTISGSPYPWRSKPEGLLTVTNSSDGVKTFAVDSVFTNMNVRISSNVVFLVTATAPEFSFGTYEPENGVTASDFIAESGLVFTADTVRVTSGTVFDTHALDGWRFDNLMFMDDAVLKFGINDGKADTLTIPGTLTLPERLSCFGYGDSGFSGGSDAVISCGEVSGAPETLTRIAGSRKVKLAYSGSAVSFTLPGTVITVR